MLMVDQWKMAVNREGETYLLFNLENDPEETSNLAGLTEHGVVEDDLRLRLLERISKTQLKEP
jgi:arylsulfatase A-like enzyme